MARSNSARLAQEKRALHSATGPITVFSMLRDVDLFTLITSGYPYVIKVNRQNWVFGREKGEIAGGKKEIDER